MKKNQKSFFAIILVFCMVLTMGNITYAAEIVKDDGESKIDSSIEMNLISCEELMELSDKNATTNASDTYVNISGYNNFIPYSQSEFSQGNGCGPTAVANILSYFQIARGVRLFDGDYVTQSIYNQICNDVGWSSSGTSMDGTSNGLRNFCNRSGKTCNIDTYMLNLWSDVTRDIEANKPILTNNVTQSHIMVILGYAIINNEKYVYVCTGTDGPLFGYIKWGADNLRMRSISIY